MYCAQLSLAHHFDLFKICEIAGTPENVCKYIRSYKSQLKILCAQRHHRVYHKNELEKKTIHTRIFISNDHITYSVALHKRFYGEYGSVYSNNHDRIETGDEKTNEKRASTRLQLNEISAEIEKAKSNARSTGEDDKTELGTNSQKIQLLLNTNSSLNFL